MALNNYDTFHPGNILLCPASQKNTTDSLLYTIVKRHFDTLYPSNPEIWADLEANMWHNYNETFRDLLVTWLSFYVIIDTEIL